MNKIIPSITDTLMHSGNSLTDDVPILVEIVEAPM